MQASDPRRRAAGLREGDFRPGMALAAWVDARLEMRASGIAGRGLFALAPLRAGEALIRWGGVVFTRAEILAGLADPESIAVLGENLYLADPARPLAGQAPVDFNLNHSCDPNLWMRDAVTLEARRPIATGEELTADYAVWMYEQGWRLEPCRCGSSLCRGVVTDQDWRIPALQERYAGHFTPYLAQIIREMPSGK